MITRVTPVSRGSLRYHRGAADIAACLEGTMRSTMWPALSFAFVGLTLVAACGDPAPSPGTITVSVSGITGKQGKLLITEARIQGRQSAISCVPIDADPFSATVVLEEIIGPTPCEDSAPIAVPGGVHDLLSAVIMGGAVTPEICARGQVSVDGDVSITLPGLTAAGCN